jgi:hypothetical protein
MKTVILGLAGVLCLGIATAQRNCSFTAYEQRQFEQSPWLRNLLNQQATLSSPYTINDANTGQRSNVGQVIRIPVVVHILYHYPNQDIDDERLHRQIAALNRDFRKMNSDTANIPAAFRSVAADCEIEFQLARVDPKGRATTGIVHKYTPIEKWTMDDKIKYSAEMGDDAWDPSSYLNIWVGNLHRLDGYASVPGDDKSKDGLVIATKYVW